MFHGFASRGAFPSRAFSYEGNNTIDVLALGTARCMHTGFFAAEKPAAVWRGVTYWSPPLASDAFMLVNVRGVSCHFVFAESLAARRAPEFFFFLVWSF